jgi:hypothetical protein
MTRSKKAAKGCRRADGEKMPFIMAFIMTFIAQAGMQKGSINS